MSRFIIGFIGAIGAGKDYTSHRIGSRLVSKGYSSVYAAKFASSLNGAVASILGIDESELQDRNLKEKKRFTFDKNGHAWSSRDVQKEVGSVFRKNLGFDVFINALSNHYNKPFYDNAIILISDLRYQNEVDWVRKQGGKVVYIHNKAAAQAQWQNELEDTTFIHHTPPESEALQWKFYNKEIQPDYWLDNNNFEDDSHFDNFVTFVVNYLEND